jgi:hypothetical protein
MAPFKLLPLSFFMLMLVAMPVQAADEAKPAEGPAAEAATPAPEKAAPAAEEKAEAKTEEKAAEKPAEKKAPVSEEKKQKVREEIVAGKKETTNPVQEWIAAENKLIDTLSKKDQQSFFIMRNKHGVIRSVNVVHRDVKAAVKACGKANPDMKASMDARFKDWENAVLPVIDLADKYLKEEIEAQKIVFPSDFKHVLKMNDKAFEYGESKIEKMPVTDKEACEGLLESMDRTENKMVELLQDMLLPESVIRDRAARAEEAEEARKAKAASEKSE